MNIQRWLARRQAYWQRLEILLKQVEKRGIKSLKAKEIRELASLYRSVSADLARARTGKLSHPTIAELQNLTARAYSQIYQGSRRQEWQLARQFYGWGFPAAIQGAWAYVAIATALFVGAGLVSWWYAWHDPSFIALIVPQDLISQVRDEGELWMGAIVGIEPLASSDIMTNNLSVSLTAIAGGITAGLLTVYILLVNGLLIGAVGTLVGQNNLAYPFWAFVFPHGSLELPAIFLAGGAGLLIARGILFPGKYRRIDALKFYGSQAVELVFGIIPLLAIAGIIEGFFSPNPNVPDAIKYLVGISLFALLLMYCSRKKPKVTL